ncbi:MAG: nucleotidyltransferase [Chloroflexi bacterium]|nr:nucleotidyltransferase [Chloroflexota bacterium]
MFKQLLARIARSLNARRIPYMVIGDQAVLLYGEPRLTRDIDITLGVDHSGLAAILELIRSMGLRALPENPQEFVAKTNVLPATAGASNLRIDFIFSRSAYEKEALARVNIIRLGKTQVNFVSAEDLVIHKIVAGRPRDLEDARSVLVKQSGERKLDLQYIHKWLAEFDAALSGDFTRTFRKILANISHKP